MIVGATRLRYLHAYDVMLPRENVRFLSATMSRDEAVGLVRESGHSRFPFSPTADLGDVTGVVLAKDLLYWLLHNENAPIDWDAIRKDVLVVPETAALPQLLHTYQDSRRHLAVVVDEYWGYRGKTTTRRAPSLASASTASARDGCP